MLTQWGKSLDQAQILPEYPRRSFAEETLKSSRRVGLRRYGADAIGAAGALCRANTRAVFTGERTFRAGRTIKPNECLWYRRHLEAPLGFDANTEDLILHFGGVDQFAEVRLNGVTLMLSRGRVPAFSVALSETFVNGIPTNSSFASG